MFPKSPACVAMFRDRPDGEIGAVANILKCIVRGRDGNEIAARITRVSKSGDMMQLDSARAVDFQLHCHVPGGGRTAWDRVRLLDGDLQLADLPLRFPAAAPNRARGGRPCAVRVCTQAWGDGNLAPGRFTRGWLGHLRTLGVANVVVNAVGELAPGLMAEIEANADLVTLRRWDATFSDADRADARAGNHRGTIEAYHRLVLTHCYLESAEFDWLLSIDLDEYVRTRKCASLCDAMRAQAGAGYDVESPRARFQLSMVVHHPFCRLDGSRNPRGAAGDADAHPPCPQQWAAAEAAAKIAAANPDRVPKGFEAGLPPSGPDREQARSAVAWKSIWKPRGDDLVHLHGGPHGPGSPHTFPLLPIDELYVAHVNKNDRRGAGVCGFAGCPTPPFRDTEFGCPAK